MRRVCINMPNGLVAMPLTVVFLVPHARSQHRKPAEGPPSTIRIEVNVVNILATVRDKHGALINNLTKDDFILTEVLDLLRLVVFGENEIVLGQVVDPWSVLVPNRG